MNEPLTADELTERVLIVLDTFAAHDRALEAQGIYLPWPNTWQRGLWLHL